MYKNKIIFIAALDWGLGHTTRCVPLIRELQAHNTIVLGVTSTTALIFKDEFPEIKKVEIEPYAISYSNKLPFILKLIIDSPRIFRVIQKENNQLKDIVTEYNIDVVISDNRFGLYHKEIECVYITHQISIQAGLFSFLANKIHHYYIKKFTSVWIPDLENETSLAGKLSKHNNFTNIKYIGVMSRLILREHDYKVQYNFDYLFLVSGPEPQRTLLEVELLKATKYSLKKIALIRGTVTPLKQKLPSNYTIINMANANEVTQCIHQAHTVVCRSGYSTLMDLYTLKKSNCILIPTQGQTEQEYLATYWQQQFSAICIQQKDIHKYRWD